jgi:hypothetical protein
MTKLKYGHYAFAALSVAVAAVVLMLLMARPSSGIEVCEQLLSAQLEDEQRCVLAGTLFVREMPVRDGITLSGRARCFDGRQFDFSQSKPHLKFEIRACEPVAC